MIVAMVFLACDFSWLARHKDFDGQAPNFTPFNAMNLESIAFNPLSRPDRATVSQARKMVVKPTIGVFHPARGRGFQQRSAAEPPAGTQDPPHLSQNSSHLVRGEKLQSKGHQSSVETSAWTGQPGSIRTRDLRMGDAVTR
jgi:hypothetical protein